MRRRWSLGGPIGIALLLGPLVSCATTQEPADGLEVAVEVRFLTMSKSALTAFSTEQETIFKKTIYQGQTVFLSDGQVRKMLSEAQSDRHTGLMQAPKMILKDGRRAPLEITDKRSVRTGLEVVREEDRVVIKPKDEVVESGLWLNVLPVVSADQQTVNLTIGLKLVNFDGYDPDLPVILVTQDKRGKEQQVAIPQTVRRPKVSALELNRSFDARNGATAIIHMGQRSSAAQAEAGPPILSDIPYLKRFFKNVGYGVENQHLLVMFTPRIVFNEPQQVLQGLAPDASAP